LKIKILNSASIPGFKSFLRCKSAAWKCKKDVCASVEIYIIPAALSHLRSNNSAPLCLIRSELSSVPIPFFASAVIFIFKHPQLLLLQSVIPLICRHIFNEYPLCEGIKLRTPERDVILYILEQAAAAARGNYFIKTRCRVLFTAQAIFNSQSLI